MLGNTRSFQTRLLKWFKQFRREFPWRNEGNPFAILLAEKLLQQTAVGPVVVNAYTALLKQYAAPKDLATANLADVERIVRPLGLTYRARELILLAQALVQRHNGTVPRTLKALLALPGVGDYAARAVLSFAFGQDVPVVDTNVARFLYRLDGISGRLPSNPSRKKSLIERAATLIPMGKSKEFNLAIIDLCALVCKPKEPLCDLCPVRQHCTYGLARLTAKLE